MRRRLRNPGSRGSLAIPTGCNRRWDRTEPFSRTLGLSKVIASLQTSSQAVAREPCSGKHEIEEPYNFDLDRQADENGLGLSLACVFAYRECSARTDCSWAGHAGHGCLGGADGSAERADAHKSSEPICGSELLLGDARRPSASACARGGARRTARHPQDPARGGGGAGSRCSTPSAPIPAPTAFRLGSACRTPGTGGYIVVLRPRRKRMTVAGTAGRRPGKTSTAARWMASFRKTKALGKCKKRCATARPSWATTTRVTSRTTGPTPKSCVLQDNMYESAASWSTPEHLYLVSGWSAVCPRRNGSPFDWWTALNRWIPPKPRHEAPRPNYDWTTTYRLPNG